MGAAPALIASNTATGVVLLGDDDAFTLARPAAPDSDGTTFTMSGQAGASGSDGGNLVVMPGAGVTSGTVILQGSSGGSDVVVHPSLMTVNIPLMTSAVDAGSSIISASTMISGTMTASVTLDTPALQSSGSVATPLVLGID